MKTVRILLLPMLLMSITALSSFTGCATDGTTSAETIPESLTQQDLEQILSDALTHFEQLNTYKFNMEIMTSIDIVDGTESWQTTTDSSIAGAANIDTQQMQMNVEMSTDSMPLGLSDSYSEMYLLSGWIYVKAELLGLGEQWIKMPATEEFTTLYNTEAIDLQIGMLESPLGIEYLRSESIDGLDCYVLSVTPNMEELAQWINEQNAGIGYLDPNEIEEEFNNLFKSLSNICFVTKDTHVIKKMTLEIVAEYSGQQMYDYMDLYDKQTISFNIDIIFYDQNLPFTVDLPDEAENAIEFTEDMLEDIFTGNMFS